MDEYINLLVLAYFKNNQDDYSYLKLSRMLGLTIANLEKYIDENIENRNLQITNDMLQLTPKGRLLLMNKSIDSLDFTEEAIESDFINPLNAWALDRPYVPEKFTSKLR